MPSSVSFPQSGGYISAIRTSTRALREASGITISQDAISKLLHSPAFSLNFKKLSQTHGLALPLNFPSLLSELNLISVLSLLNFGSGYRVPLHTHTGRGAWDSIRAFVLSLFITSSAEGDGDLLSARAMKAINVGKVAELMQLPTHVERPHESIPGVVVGELGGPLYELAKLVTTTLNETGEILLSQGYPDLGSFVLEALREGDKYGKKHGGGVNIDVVLEKIVLAIPAFRDMALINGKPVYVFKKALFLLHATTLRFFSRSQGDSISGTIPILDTSVLPVFSDNVIPSILVHLGIIDTSGSSPSLAVAFQTSKDLNVLLQPPSGEIKEQKGQVPKDGPVLDEYDAYILRASAIDACELIVEEAHKVTGEDSEWLRKLTLPELDAWLWAGAKDRRDYRDLERFVLRGTVYF